MAHDKYHAELKFWHDRKVRFTAVSLSRLMARFAAEVEKEVARSNAAREYTWITPNLTVEVCRSWAEFDQYEHS